MFEKRRLGILVGSYTSCFGSAPGDPGRLTVGGRTLRNGPREEASNGR